MWSIAPRKVWRYLRWVLLIALFCIIALTALGYWHLGVEKNTADAVAAIHSRHLTMADVDGSRLPQPPDPKHKDATVQGIDVNNNGIRDDVELAIFAKYPTSPYTRVAELQYALAVGMYLTQVIDSDTLVAVAQEEERASDCIADSIPRDDLSTYRSVLNSRKDEVKQLVINTEARRLVAEKNTGLVKSFGSLSGPDCDVDASELSK